MVKTNNNKQQQPQQSRPLAVTDRSSMNASGSYADNTFCVVLHVVEAINFYGREMREGERDQIVMNAALNTVDFEVEGTPSVTTETIIFNSNCIWECDMTGIKRIKTDHRPVKVTFFACNSSSAQRKTIGSLLLPVRGIPVLGLGGNNSPMQLKMFWHKLICISNEFRSHKPEVLLMLTIIKKSLLHTKEFKHLMVFNSAEKQPRVPPLQSPGHSITANMLQSQANVYVQSLVQLGLLQVGNNPLVDCDIIEVVLQFKQLKNLNKFVKSIFHSKEVNVVLLMFDFVGNVTNIELKLNESDCYTLDDVLGLRFKSSLRSIRLYFQRIFYLPINMYVNGTSIANYRMDFGKLLPSDKYFADTRKFTQSGSFAFERFGRLGSARELKPIMDYTFTVDIQEVCWRHQERKQTSPQPQLQDQDMQDQLSLNCVGSKAVIHEVPKDRVSKSIGEYPKLLSEELPKPENVSINSLNVGAELSDSDERESALESLLSDTADSDAAENGQKLLLRRKKFTRFLEVEQDEGADIHYLPEDVGYEAEPELVYSNSKFCRDNSNADEANMSQRLKQCSRNILETSEVIQSERKQTSAGVNELNGLLLDRQSLKLGKTGNTNKHERSGSQMSGAKNTDKEISNHQHLNSKPEQEAENISHVTTDSRTKRTIKEKKAETIPKASNSNSNNLQPNDLIFKEPSQAIGSKHQPSSVENALFVKPKVILKKKNALKTEEFQQLEDAEMAKIISKSQNGSNPMSQNRYIMSDDSFLRAEHDSELPCRVQKSVKKTKKMLIDNPEKDTHSARETDKREKPNTQIKQNESKVLFHVESEACETILVKKPQETRKKAMSQKNDLCLSARWVEVSRDQANALEDTEKFIDETCRESSYLKRSSDTSRKPSRKKRDIVYLSSEREDSSFVEEHSRESRVERKVLKKSKEIEVNCRIQKSDELLNEKLPKKNILKDFDILESELTELEEFGLIQSPAIKSRRVTKKSSVQDTMELRHIYDAIDWEQPEKRKTVKTEAQLQQPEANSIEQEIQKKSLKKKTAGGAAKPETERSESNLESQVSRLEVTVHMIEQSKNNAGGETNKCKNKEVITDTNNMNERLRQILVASMDLKDDMRLKALEYLRTLGQGKLGTPSQTAAEDEAHFMDASYAFKFNELEQHIVVLEENLRKFESRTIEIQSENTKLAQEKMQLKQRISYMEQQIAELRHQTPNGNELKQVLTEMRQQNVRYQDISNARDRYKKQWRRAVKRIHALKLAMYEKSVEKEYQSAESNVLNLKNILTKDADEFEREYGRFRKPNAAISFSGSTETSEPLLKDYLRVLSNQRLEKHKPSNPVDSTRMH